MKMKFNWGTGIFIVITLFILSVVVFFIYISNLDIKLVEDNYYEKELAFQDRIDRLKNTTELPWKVELKQGPGIIVLQFPILEPKIDPKGALLFYRPSNPDIDFSVPIQLNDSACQVIDITAIKPGKWVLKLEWSMVGKEFYQEEEIIIGN